MAAKKQKPQRQGNRSKHLRKGQTIFIDGVEYVLLKVRRLTDKSRLELERVAAVEKMLRKADRD